MKKIPLILLLGVIVAIGLLFNGNDNSSQGDFNNFAIKDTSIITKIFFADKFDNTVILTKKNNKWLVDGKYPVRKDALRYLMSTISDIRVKHPVSNSLHDKIVKNLATSAVKVEFYTNDTLQVYKSYYVGGESKDLIGSYMLMENSNRSYVVYIPGFNGFLAPRYNIDGFLISQDLWRDRRLFNYDISSMKSVEVINHDDSLKSFTIFRQKDTYSISRNNTVKPISLENGNIYFNLFKQVNCEGFMNDFSKKDSIINSKPYYTITVTDTANSKKTITTFHKAPERIEYLDNNGEKLKYDVDRMYAQLNEDFLLIQFFVFDKILLRSPQFNVEK
ncbi:MAG: hypothetical protein ACON4E_06545 [Flavobacteriales bacterium]